VPADTESRVGAGGPRIINRQGATGTTRILGRGQCAVEDFNDSGQAVEKQGDHALIAN
jgi:hypothetical protein